ncbi:MAG: PAS domain S-box protein [Prochlorotrichaceae cyanobacterium]
MLSLTDRVASVHENLAMAIVQDPLVVLPETTLGEAIVLMSQARSFCAADSDLLPHTSVVQNEARSSCVLIQEDQKVMGILTERDVVCLCSQGSQMFNQIPVNQVMTTPVRTLRKSEFANLYSAISVLQKHHIRHLPLVDEEGNLLGLLTHETLRQLLQPTDLLRLRLVHEVMVPVVITAEPTESLLTVVQRLARHRVSCVVVAEERPTAAGSLRIPIGIVTERDIVQFKALELDFQGYTVAQVMSAPVVTIAETESLVTVHELMEQSFIRRVVVTGKEGELRGIVTQSNVLQLLSPLELYKLTVVLETKIKNLEAEKVALLKNRNLQLEVEINARMAELQKQVKREQIITTLASQIRSSLSLPKILEMAVEEIRQIIGCDRVNIWKCEPERSIVVVAESTSLERSLMGERIQDHCWEIHFAAGDQPDPVSDVYSAEMTDDCRALLIRLQIRATVLVPILYGDQLWGVLSIVETETPRNWEPEEVDLIQNLATHVAIAIQQASRHEQLKIELQEREKIEAELRNITQHLEAAHRIASLGTWELDPHSNRIYWSEEVFRIFEVDPQTFEASYETFLSLVHPDDRDEVNTIYQQHLSGHRSYEMVHRLLMPDGRIKYVYEQCETTCSEDGTPLISRGTVQDITRQKEAELEQRRIAQEVVTLNAELEQRVLERTAELTEREATLADFVNNANDLIQIVELDTGKFEFVNQAWQKILGYTVPELNGLTIFEILDPDCQIAFQTLLDQMATGRVTDVEQMELTLIAKSGQAIVVQGNINCRCKTDEGGHERPCSVRAILRDITAKKAAEIALQASEAKYRQIVETAHEGIWMIDADAKHQFANAALLQMLGYTRAEMEGRSLFDFFSPALHPNVQALLKRRSEGIAETNEVPLVRKDGSTLWVLSTGSPIFNKAGQYVGAMSMVTDITQRRQADEERQRLLQELSGFKLGLDESAIVAITDPQGVILYTNQRFIDISGYSEAELLGQTHRLVNSGTHPPAFFQDLWRTIRKGEVWRGEICNRAKEGPLYWVDSTIVPFLNAQGQPDRYLAVRFDITQRKQAEQLLQEKLELLREVTAAQSQFITAQNRLEIFERLLATLLDVSNSEYGFIGEVLFRTDGSAYLEESFLKIRGVPYLKTHSLTNIAWDETTQKLYEDNYAQGMEFTNMNTLFGAVVMTGKPVIANSPSTDPRRGGTPAGHPPLNAFLGLPFYSGSSLIGMVGVANRPGGYSEDLIEQLHPLLITCSNLIEGYRQDRLRRQAEKALQESQQSLQRQLTAIEAAVDGIAILQEGRYVYLNSAHVEMFGYDRAEELLGQTWQMLYPPAELDRFEQEVFPDLQDHQYWTGQATATRKDGTTFTEQLSLTFSEDNLLICVCQDITEQKQAEIALRESEQRYLTLAQAAPVGIFRFDLEANCIYVNDGWCKMTGKPASWATRWMESLHPDDREFTQAKLQAWLSEGTPENPLQNEARFLRDDGSVIWFYCQMQVEINTQGEPIGYVGTLTDISDRKHAELLIHQQAERETLLREITQRIRQSLDLQTIFDTACAEIRQVLGADRVGIFKFIPSHQFSHGSFLAESQQPELPSVLAIPVHDHCFGENYAGIYTQGQFFVIEDLEAAELQPCHREVYAQFGVRSALILPLLCGSNLWGLLCIHQCYAPRQWQDREITFTQQLANQLALAIQQASLLAQAQNEVEERQQAQANIALQLRRQQTLATITELILQRSLDLDQILATVALQVKEVLQGDRVIIFRLYPDGSSAIVEEAVTEGLPRLRTMHWDDEVWNQEILDLYWQGKPRIVPDVMDDVWTDCLVDYSAIGEIQSKIVAPILQEMGNEEYHRWVAPQTSKQLWGIIVIHSCRQKRIWQDNEAQLLQQIANQTAIAIQQANLFDQLQQELQERQQTQNLLTQRNEELAVSNIELERATRLKDEFLANMSHELRTPLNSILGMGEALQEEVFGILNEKQLKALRTVEKSASHLLTLINDILDVAKIESGEVKLEYSYVSVEQLCSSSLAFIKQHALKKRIQLQTEIASGLPAVFVDEVRMRQVLLNLLTNAVKFTLEGGTVTLAAFLVPQEDHKQVLRLSIKDTGIGISPENLDRLFKPFVQIDGALNRQQMGTGLGLTLVKQLVELHGGKVHLSSEPGVGSCFTIDLPAGSTFSSEPSAEEPPAQTNALPAPDQETSQKSLILLAEDDLANIETIACYLEAKGYAMVFANDGQEAIDLVQKNLPDLIVMDIQMPGMDGLEAIGLIRQMERLQNIPIIALTALAMKGDQERCLDAGANLYLSKPVKLKQLDTAIKALLKDA